MKKRIEMLVKNPKMLVSTFAVFLVFVIGVTGCTFSSAKNEEEIETEIETKADATATETKEKDETEEPEVIDQTEKTEETSQKPPIVESLVTKIEDIPEGAYCLWFFPDELCFQKNFVDGVNNMDGVYYVPNENKQKKIREILAASEKKKRVSSEAEYYLIYKTDKENFTRIGADMQCDIDDENVHTHTSMVNPKLHKFLSKILKDEFQYEPIEIATIKNIESATLDYVHPMTKKQYSQTIKEKEILDRFGDWFSHAKACCSGDRPCFNGLLTLKLKSGKVIKLTMASTGVTYFSVNGGLYDYEPKNKPEGFDEYAVFECFDEIPYYNYSE